MDPRPSGRIFGRMGIVQGGGLSARTLEATKPLGIVREDSHELLSDDAEITAAPFSAPVKRFKKLVEA